MKLLKKIMFINPKSASASFILTTSLLIITKIKVKFPILMADRFWPGSGWLEIFLLAIYSAYITDKMIDKKNFSKYRQWIWTSFSFIFFIQLILGLSGLEIFLMTGKLHFPIPALIVAGPIYRGGGFFMPILLTVTIFLAGPAWCSFLCYIGSWDLLASKAKKKPVVIGKWHQVMRTLILFGVVLLAIVLRSTGVSIAISIGVVLIFTTGALFAMIYWSRKKGLMMHCIAYCPIGIITNVLGKISPFRLRISNNCTKCKACETVCRYNALNFEGNVIPQPALSCTLCGDCITTCKYNTINYRFFNMNPDNARALFIIIVISLHSVFLALARI